VRACVCMCLENQRIVREREHTHACMDLFCTTVYIGGREEHRGSGVWRARFRACSFLIMIRQWADPRQAPVPSRGARYQRPPRWARGYTPSDPPRLRERGKIIVRHGQAAFPLTCFLPLPSAPPQSTCCRVLQPDEYQYGDATAEPDTGLLLLREYRERERERE